LINRPNLFLIIGSRNLFLSDIMYYKIGHGILLTRSWQTCQTHPHWAGDTCIFICASHGCVYGRL